MPTTVAPGVHVIGLLMVNVVLLEGRDGWTLIDTGTEGTLGRLRASLRRIGAPAGDLRRVLITHAHPDHVGGLAELARASGAEVWASEADRAWVEGPGWPPRPDPATLRGVHRLLGRIEPTAATPVPVDRVLRGGDRLDAVREGLEVVALPGHTLGQVGFWLRSERVIVAGDALMHVFPWWHPPIAGFSSDMQQARRSVERMAALEPRVVVVGHGPPVSLPAGAASSASLAPRLRRALRTFPPADDARG
ncbi:MAG: MBL fold metallo-hydrolase [Trueperaceae bacterium]|nr:MBL fold metallo-hydrolase [Trueperaceae bacterium]